MNECILVVDDDREIVGAIAIVLEREGYTVRRAYDGLGAVEQALDPAVRLILIDVMMPKLDGLSALMRIREKRNLPVIVLSAKSEDTDKILGLSMGADDYVTKPYNPQELAARVRSQLRRYTLLGDVHAEKREGEIVNGRLSYDPERRELKADGELVKLTATELKIYTCILSTSSSMTTLRNLILWLASYLDAFIFLPRCTTLVRQPHYAGGRCADKLEEYTAVLGNRASLDSIAGTYNGVLPFRSS